MFRARPERLPARKLWIAFAVASKGQIVVDAGARRALTERSVSLLPAGVLRMQGTFETGDAVELVDPEGVVFAKGLVRYGSAALSGSAGRRSNEIDPELPVEVIHRDDLVLLP